MRAEKNAKAKKLATVFAGRESLSIDEFYQRYYGATDIPYSVVAGIINILAEQLDADMSRLSMNDDFSKNLNFFWDYDSMANVEIIYALEKEFNIKILDEEAEKTETVNDIINLVISKMGLSTNIELL
ncbi:MAG: acyl carrier protein [Methylococcales bacterium]|nr:acyl carrier protein [Methylococcales bacterium]